MTKISDFDQQILEAARENLRQFVLRSSQQMPKTGLMLEIGAQGRTYLQDCFAAWEIESFDLVDDFKPDYVGDITRHNPQIPDHQFDAIACMEVLEHTVNPFAAIEELRRLLKPGGILLVSAPLNFRIHGPLPDCWRFTEFGWRVLLKDFNIEELDVMESPERELFPIKYNLRARVDHQKDVDPRKMEFLRI
ncbi:MAG: methyltransferase type 11 [Bacteroidetes bacterium]|nr:MAG: methyltransferase type 11 [Bacteroidota bacterium]